MSRSLFFQVDATGEKLEVRENGLDIKIHLKTGLSGKIFNKGHGKMGACHL